MCSKIRFTIIVCIFFVFTTNHADWPRYLGTNSDGIATDTKIARSWSKKGPKVLWAKNLGMGYGGASIRDNEVYILDRVANQKDVLRCFNLKNGKELWSKSFAAAGRLPYNGSRSTPTIGEKRIYAFSPFGNIYCVDRKTHKIVWVRNLLATYRFKSTPHRWGFAQSPLLYQGKIILAPCIARRAGVVAFDAETGKEVWNNKDKTLRGQTYVSPVVYNIAGEDQIIVMAARTTAGVDPKTGKTLWVYKGYKNPIPIPTVTALGGDRFFVTGGYRSGSVIIEIKKQNNKYNIKTLLKMKQGAQIHPGILINDHIYVNFNENANLRGNPPNLTCLSTNGKVKWNSRKGPAIGRGGIIAVDGLLLILGGASGVLHLIEPDPRGFKELTKAQIFNQARENYIWAGMAFSQGMLVLRDQKTLKCLDLR